MFLQYTNFGLSPLILALPLGVAAVCTANVGFGSLPTHTKTLPAQVKTLSAHKQRKTFHHYSCLLFNFGLLALFPHRLNDICLEERCYI
ncbi:hypothetical protein DP113_31490 [Brasilonema octagenarum UFV-E1]|uniref:Uncharacterized protein n=1 Tax=Brasilonema sennae CENA114 TaxID=415709 RepID=A0A856MNT2_9CYAN|nr:hypothetical protein DP114_31350 [Brasilonema sennae CENA114]QDL18174.1 hypothetical protein DP113_31490 [Brasilonema octagenarum UFV-E1]